MWHLRGAFIPIGRARICEHYDDATPRPTALRQAGIPLIMIGFPTLFRDAGEMPCIDDISD
jgi:hypothetical protein